MNMYALLICCHGNRLAMLKAEQEQQLTSLQEGSEGAKKQAAALQEQISMLQ